MGRKRISNETKAKAIAYVHSGAHVRKVASVLGISQATVQQLTWPIKGVETKADMAKGRVCIIEMKKIYESLKFIVVDGGGYSLEIIGYPIIPGMSDIAE